MRNGMRVLASVLVFGSMTSVFAQSNFQLGPSAGQDINARFGINRPGFNFGGNPGGNSGWDNDRPGRGNGNGGHGQQNERTFTEVEYIGQEVQAGEKVFLGRAFNLQRDHKDQEVDTIEVTVQGLRRGGAAKLLVNGQRMGQVKDFDGRRFDEQTLKWTLPQQELIVGENLRTLQVEFEGRAFVMEATLTFKEQSRGGRPSRPARPFIVDVQHDFHGDGDIALASLISADYEQYKTKADKIALQLQGPSFRASVQLCKMDKPWECGAMKYVSFRDNLLELDAPANSEVGELIVKARGQFSIGQVVVFPSRF